MSTLDGDPTGAVHAIRPGIMKTITIRESSEGVLIPLQSVVGKIPEMDTAYWVFRSVQLNQGMPFGIHVDDFERLSRELKGGFIVSTEDFKNFLASDLQIVDGVIEAWDRSGMLISFDCVDATQWELSSDRAGLMEQITADLVSR